MIELDGSHLEYDISKRNTIPARYKGKQAFLITEGELVEQVQKHYGRPEAVLKVFNVPMEGDLKDYYWGSPWRIYSVERTEEICKISKLWEATIIQNLLWMGGYAPRIYGFAIINKDGNRYPAQVTEFVKGDEAPSAEWVATQRFAVEEYLKEFGCVPHHKEQAGVRDYIGGKLIDPQGCRFTKDTHQKIVEYIRKLGVYGKGIYQSDKQLGFGAHPRDTDKRIEQMGLNTVDFTGKDVLDVGCNIGVFCNYAERAGARRVVGIDAPEVARAAQVMSFYLGCHNIDYYGKDLLKENTEGDFDITLFLSMNVHIGFPEWVAEQTKSLMIFEENAKGGNYETHKWIKFLRSFFKEVIQRGVSTDHNPAQPKPILFCHK